MAAKTVPILNEKRELLISYYVRNILQNSDLVFPDDIKNVIINFYGYMLNDYDASWSPFSNKFTQNSSIKCEKPLSFEGITKWWIHVYIEFPFSHNFYGIYTHGARIGFDYCYQGKFKNLYGISARMDLLSNAKIKEKGLIDGNEHGYNKKEFKTNKLIKILFEFDCSINDYIYFNIYVDGLLINKNGNKFTFEIEYPNEKNKIKYYPVACQYQNGGNTYCEIIPFQS